MSTEHKWSWRRTVGLLAMAAVLLRGVGATAEPSGGPVLRIPKISAPPTIDGTIGDEEWKEASAMTGFSTVTSPFPRQQHPADMRAVWRLGYDDTHLYLAMHLRVPAGVTLNAQTKNPDDMDSENAVLFGDHVEIQISPHAPPRPMETGFGFYKFTVNPFDIWADYWHRCDEAGNESAWNSGARVKSTWDLNNWRLEMAIPVVGTMNHPEGGLIRKMDGLELRMQLVNAGSCVGFSWAGWVPATWQAWDRFYRVVLDPAAPVMQFLDTGDLVDGKLDATLRLRGAPDQAATVKVEVLDGNGKTAFTRTEQAPLNPGAWREIRFREPALALPVWTDQRGETDKRNLMRLQVEAGGRTIYSAELPFAKQSAELRDLTYGAYVRTLPKGDYLTRVAYIARNGKLRVVVDTDTMGDVPQAVRQAQRFRLRVRPEAGGAPVLERELGIVKGVGSHLLELGPLEGRYLVTLELLDAGGKVVSTREHHFARTRHEWEGNTIGEERVVIPPFRPIAFGDRTLATRLARFELDEGGLWRVLTVLDRPLLTAPMRLEGVVNGQEAVWQGQSVGVEKGPGRAFPPEFDPYAFLQRNCPKIPFEKLPETDGYEAIVKGQGSVGPIAVDIKSTLDYDGHTRFEIRYAPTGGAVRVDRLEVVLDLFDGVNGMLIAREVGANGFRSLPRDQQGTLWESASLRGRSPRFRGTFVPLLHLGDGRFGLQFRAASDEGWLLDDAISCQRVERHGKTVRLRLLLVNAPATLAAARKVSFALMPVPAKTAPPNTRYHMWGSPKRDYVHHAFGWRKYGTGADNWYLPSDADYVRLGEFMREGKGPIKDTRAQTQPVMMYSSTLAVGAPLPDCDSFKGQWYNDSEYDPGRRATVQYGGKGMDPTKTFAWDRPECFTEARPKGWDEDVNDNYLWFHRKLTALTQTHGTYWDNAEIQHDLNLDAGTYGYVRDDGHKQPTNNSEQRRSLMKRLYTMSWLEGLPPLHNGKWPFQAPFQTFSYMMEGNWYLYSQEGSFFDAHGRDMAQLRFFRDSLETPGMMKPKIPGIEDRVFDQAGARSYLALALLHDVGLDQVSADNSALIRQLNEAIGFLDRERQAEFIPYWETAGLAGFVEWQADRAGRLSWREGQPDDVYVSIYRAQAEPKRALLWIVNAGTTPRLTGLRLDAQALTGRPRRDVIVRDIETGIQLRKHLPDSVKAANDKETLWRSFLLKPRDYVGLMVEQGDYVNPPHPVAWP